MQLEFHRIVLRDFCAGDIADYQAYHADPRYLRYYAPEVSDPAHARKLVERFIESAHAQPRRDFTMAIVERTSSELIGCCSLRTAGQEDGYAEFGVELSPTFWGRGLAVEAARGLLEFGFSALKLSEIRGLSVTENRRVEHLVTKLGFKKVRECDGASWMSRLGWTHTEWSLTKSALSAGRATIGFSGRRSRAAADPRDRSPGRAMFVPITMDDYVEKHLAANPGVRRAELIERLQYALASARAGARCECGNPIWVIGSAEVGLSCFTCITGEAVPSEDYEIDEALAV